jgi:hypothetical protein
MCPTVMSCLTTGPEQWGQMVMERKLQNYETKSTLSLSKFISSIICPSNEKLPNLSTPVV